MSETSPPPAGWYPDPKPADPDHAGERWWNGSEWTVSTRTDETTVFISGEPPTDGRPRRRAGRVLVGTVAALLGLGVGSLTTFLVMDGHDSHAAASATKPGLRGQSPNGGDGLNPFGGQGGNGGSNGGTGNGGTGGGQSGTGLAVDLADGVSFPVPSGWRGGSTGDGHAAAYFGSYTCANDATATCSLAGANTVTLTAKVADGVQAAAEADIAAAAKESYGDLTGHQVLEAKAVTVAGRSGYLVRWQADAKVGNNGTVETVVFPNKAGDKLVALRLGFDITSKAPAVSVMDTIVSGLADFTGTATGGTGLAPGTS